MFILSYHLYLTFFPADKASCEYNQTLEKKLFIVRVCVFGRVADPSILFGSGLWKSSDNVLSQGYILSKIQCREMAAGQKIKNEDLVERNEKAERKTQENYI